MNRVTLVLGMFLVAIGLDVLETTAWAVITAEQRKEIAKIKDDLGDIPKLIREKKYDEAHKLVDDAATKLDKISKDAELKPGDKTLLPVQIQLDRHRQTLAKLAGKGGVDANDVSFI